MPDFNSDADNRHPFIGDLFGEIALAEEAESRTLRFHKPKEFIRGIVLCGTVALAASWLAEHYGMPAILIGLLLGMALGFTALDKRAHPGLDLIAREGLRLGIVLIGFQITLGQIAEVGLIPLLALVGIMLAAFGGGLAGAALAGQSRYAGILAGGATAICGASAALALYSVIGKDRLPQAYFALTLVGIALASALAMTVYPVLAAYLGLTDKAAGFLIGASVHDVAQAIGGGYSFSDRAGEQATIVKLARVALLAPVVLLVTLWIGNAKSTGSQPVLKQLMPPWFILAFLALVALNSLFPVPVWVSQNTAVGAKALLLMAVTSTALRARTDLVLELGWRAALPVMLATLASFAAAVLLAMAILD